MKLDLRKEFAELYDYLTARVRAFDPAKNDGPGKPGPVKMIEVGYEWEQSGWISVVFDTRPDASPDGEWNSHIEGNTLERPRWAELCEAIEADAISFKGLDGSSGTLPAGSDLTEPIGEMIKAVLLKARADGVFASLPKASVCEIGVEHQDGDYGWPDYEDRGKENLV